MWGRFRNLRRLFVDLPKQVRLAYCLIRDPRVPVYTRLAFAGGLGLLLSPMVNLPKNRAIPLVGEIDSVAVTLLALRLFIAACPDEVVIDQEQLIAEQRSVFDDDVRAAERIALSLTKRFRGEDEQSIVGSYQGETAQSWTATSSGDNAE